MAVDRTTYFENRAAARSQKAMDLRAAATPQPATPEAPATRSFGFQSGAAKGADEARANSLTQAASELGAPTSYAGGEGAPMPVEVVRGTKTTYTNPAPAGEGPGYNPNPSQNTQEFGSLVQARQAFNRGAGVGEFVPPEGPKLQAAAEADVTGAKAYHEGQAKVQEGIAAAEKLGADKAAFRTNFVDQHGVMDPKTKQLGLPPDENLTRIYKQGEYHISQGAKPDEAYAKIAPELHSHYYTPENVDKALNLISQQTGQPITPARRAKALEGSPEAKAQLYPYIQQSLRAPKPGFWGSAARNVVAPDQNVTP